MLSENNNEKKNYDNKKYHKSKNNNLNKNSSNVKDDLNSTNNSKKSTVELQNSTNQNKNVQAEKTSQDQNLNSKESTNSGTKKQFKKHQFRDKPSLMVSVVIPLLNEEESLPKLSQLLEEELTKLSNNSYEVLFIDDGSTDKSFEVISEINKKNPKFKCIRFRRNYGKSAALSVGFAQARGRFIYTMDADLQDDPKELVNLMNKLNEGYDLVSGWKKTRHDPFSKTFPSKFFNYVTSKTSGITLHDFNCGLKLYKKEVAKSLDVYGEMHRYLPALAHIDGFRVTELPVIHHAREFGKSKFGASRFIKGFLDLLTVMFVTRYLKRPMHLFGTLGSASILGGLLVDLYLTIEWFNNKTSLSNRPLLFLGLGLIIVGVQLVGIGLLGEMITKSTKKENYNIKETLY